MEYTLFFNMMSSSARGVLEFGKKCLNWVKHETIGMLKNLSVQKLSKMQDIIKLPSDIETVYKIILKSLW